MLRSLKKLAKKSSFIIFLFDRMRQLYYKYFFSDVAMVKKMFKKEMGREVNLNNPKEFSDKIQWLKLNWYDPLATKCADKYEVRDFVRERVGEEILNELYAVYDSVEEIDISELPTSFVLKGTHGSGFNIVCHDKSKVNWEEAFVKMRRWLNLNYFYKYREWVYKDIQPRIICEKYLSEDNEKTSLTDYKFYCFNGDPLYCQVIKNREFGGTIDFFDKEWNRMEFNGLQEMPHSKGKIPKPEGYKNMLEYARNLSKDFPFVRVDLYYVKRRIYFGELTFFPRSGFGSFSPPEWNTKIGNLLKLPQD